MLSGAGAALALGVFAFVSPILAPAAIGAGLVVLVLGIAAAPLFSLVAFALFISGTMDRISSPKTDKVAYESLPKERSKIDKVIIQNQSETDIMNVTVTEENAVEVAKDLIALAKKKVYRNGV